MTRHLIDLETPTEKVFLVAVDTGSEDGWTAQDSLAELASLAATAGADVVGAEWQNRRHVDPNWYVGKGKAEDLVAAKRETGFDILIADDELSPAQQRALEGVLNVKVIDRSRLILDIFALHAQTHEGRLQVELAQLEYQLPRLTKLWTHLSRTQGGIGSRGPGESQLETDRRIIRTRISKMKERVEQVRQQRETAARGRDRRLWPTVGIVGYTNAGKSTLLNALVGSEVAKAEDKLFATLDPTSRQVKLGDGQSAIVTDTVGFIHKLPHQLVDAFRATLEEVNRADVLVEVVDASDPHAEEHRATVQTVLDELGAGDKPRLVAFNKADLVIAAAEDGTTPAPAIAGSVFVSALTGYGLDTLRAEIAAVLASLWVDVDVALPYSAGELLARVRERGTVELEYGERDVRIVGRVAPALAGELEAIAEAWRLTNEDAADDEPRGASAAPTGRPTKAARRAADADDAAEAASEAVGRGTERFTTDGELVIDPAGDAQQGTANGTETQTGTEAAATR
jgi:GTPase